MKALPYGLSDFPRVMRKNYYYVDKTRFIELIERQPSYLFLIRPRRFGVVIFLFSFALSACVNKATSRDPLEF